MVEIFSGIVFIIFGGLIFFFSRGFRQFTVEQGMGPDSMPKLYAVFMIALALMLILSALIKITKNKNTQNNSGSDGVIGKLSAETIERLKISGVTIVAFFIYLFMLRPLGFLIATPPLVFFVMKIMLAKTRNAIMVAILLTAVIFVIFRTLLGVPLPIGIPLRGIIW